MADEEQKSIEEDEESTEEGGIKGEEDEGPKISLPEGIIMVMISLTADIMDVVGSLTVFLIPISLLIDFSYLAIIPLWLTIKGGIGFRRQAGALIGGLIEFIPILDILPIRTVTLLVAIYMINHPKAAKLAAPVKTK